MTLCDLPKDLLLSLFSKLEALDIGELCLVNRRCHEKICRRDSFWKSLIAEKYPLFAGLDNAIIDYGQKTWFDGYAKIEFMYQITKDNDAATILEIVLSEPDLFYIWSKIYTDNFGQKKLERKIFEFLPLIVENNAFFALSNIDPSHFSQADIVSKIRNYNPDQLRFLEQNGFKFNQAAILNRAIKMGSLSLTKYILANHIAPNVEIANKILKEFPDLQLFEFLASHNVYPNDPTGQYIDNIYDKEVLDWLKLNNIYSPEQVGRRKLKLPLF